MIGRGLGRIFVFLIFCRHRVRCRGGPEEKASRIGGDLAGTAGAFSRDPFVEKTEGSGGSGYDADTVLGVRYGVHERAVIDLGTGEEPAGTVPERTLTSLPSQTRVALAEGRSTRRSPSPCGLGEGLLEDFHVVRAPEGGMLVDFFARKPFRYRVLGLQDPARLVVDLEATGEHSQEPLPAQGGDTVLVEPRASSIIPDPLTVSGYSRNPECANTITLTGPRGKILVRRSVEGNDWGHTWGYFEATIDLPPFSGKGTLKVGTGSARHGTFEGVEIPVLAGR